MFSAIAPPVSIFKNCDHTMAALARGNALTVVDIHVQANERQPLTLRP